MNDWLRTILFLPPQSSTVAASVDHLHFFVILTTMGGATLVALLALWFIIRYRRPLELVTPHPQAPPTTPGWVEAIIVGGLFSLFLAWWVIGFLQYVRLRVSPEETYDVYVTAKQWMWKFAYPDGHHSLSELYVPTGRPVKLIMSSRDVIHSFYVPDFRVKQDVLPGRYTTLWFEVKDPGSHDVLCAEYCGTNHSMMRAQVIALPPAEFSRWLSSAPNVDETPAPTARDPQAAIELGPSRPLSLARLGEQIAAQTGCLRCHTLDGSPHIGPTWAGLYRSIVSLEGGGTVIADEAYLTESMMDPRARLHAGFPPVMPSYLGRLRPAEVSALLQLIKSVQEVPARAAAQEAGETPLLRPLPGVGAPAPGGEGLPPPGATVVPPAAAERAVGPEEQPVRPEARPR